MSSLPEIFVALPPHVADELVRQLEREQLSANPTVEEVRRSAAELIAYMKNGNFPGEPPEVHRLLDQVPQAVVEQLFRD